MSDQAPEAPPGGGGGSWLQRTGRLGMPNWLMVTVGAAGVATVYLWWRKRKSSKSAAAPATSTATSSVCQDANGNTVDCNSALAVTSEGQAQYEQLTSQLTGLSGQQAALAQSIGQLQGQPAPAGSQLPNVQGMNLADATAAVQKAGLNLVTVEEQGIAGQRFASTLNPAQAAAVQNAPVSGIQSGPGDKNVTLWVNPT